MGQHFMLSVKLFTRIASCMYFKLQLTEVAIAVCPQSVISWQLF